MIRGRTPNIRTEQLRAFANKLVSSSNNKFGNKPISKEKFNKLIEHAQFEHASTLRGGRKVMTTHETKKFLGAFLQHIQEHPEYKVSTYARKALNVKLHQGDNLIEHFDPEHIGEKGLAFVANAQQEADAAKNTGPTEQEKLQQLRRERAMKFLNLYRSKQERDDLASGKKTITPTSVTASQAQKSSTSATSHEGAGTIAGKSQVAGRPSSDAPAAPGTDTHPATSRQPVQLAGGIGHHVSRGPNHAPTPGTGMPTIGAPDVRSTPAPTEGTPAAPSEDNELPSTDDVDKNLPLAA